MLKNKNLIIFISLILVFTFSLGVMAISEKQAPELQRLVSDGELEPLAERLPEEPLVIEPYHEIGSYGGTWTKFDNSETFAWQRQVMYGWSPIRWINDTQDMAPNLLTDWVPNEDQSVWTLYFRKGIKWSDGEPLTVDDFLFWWKDLALNTEYPESEPPFTIAGGEVMQATKLDDFTVELEFVAPNPLLPSRLANWVNGGIGPFFAAPKHYLSQFHPDYSDEYDSYETIEEKIEWWINIECPVLTEWMPVDSETGSHLVLERNPYYYAVDTEGNQLPYIDQIRVEYIMDSEVFRLKVASGESEMIITPNILTVEDISLLHANSEQYDYEVLLWDTGTGAGPAYTLNRNHPDDQKRDLYNTREFSLALSHAINRDRINRMIFYDTAFTTTGTISPKAVEYHRTEEGQQIFEEWRDLAKSFEPQKSEDLLDEIGIVDQNGDGWRQFPDGDEIILRIDAGTNFPPHIIDSIQLVKENWEDIGLETIINTVDGAQLGVMQENAEFDIRTWPGGVPDGANHLVYPQWIAPVGIGSQRWAPLYGTYFSIKGTAREERIDWDKPPRERTPPLAKPDDDSPQVRLNELYEKAITTPDWEERDAIVREMIRVHMEEGPFFIGTVANYPAPGIVKNNMKNVPRAEDLPTGGYYNGWAVPTPAPYKPMQYFIEE